MARGQLQEQDETEEHKSYMNKTQKRVTKAKQAAQTGGTYTGPTIITHKVEKTGNNCVITNDTHSK